MQGKTFDVCVLGAGPAGLGAAYTLAAANSNVALIHADGVNRTVNTGETLHPGILNSISKMGLDPEFEKLKMNTIAGFESTWGSAVPASRSAMMSPDGGGWLFDRGKFEGMLRQQAEYKGAKLYNGCVTGMTRQDEKWLIEITSDTAISTIEAYQVIVATGRKAASFFPVGRKISIDKLICYTLEISSKSADQLVRIDALEQGWLYSIQPTAEVRVVCFFTDGDLFKEKEPVRIRQFISDLIPQAPCISQIISPSVPDDTAKISIVSADTSYRQNTYGKGWIACGDLVQTFDPLSAQGISAALLDGIEAAVTTLDVLSGIQEACKINEWRRRMNFMKYLKDRAAYYRSETRWGDARFWVRRQN